MKSLYQCEKCKKVFDEYEEANQCEESHTSYVNGFDWDDNEDFKLNVMNHTKYEEGNPDPVQIAIMLTREYYNTEESTWKKERSIGIYKLKSLLPLGDK